MVVRVSIDRNVKFRFIGQNIEATCSLKNWVQTFATRLYTTNELRYFRNQENISYCIQQWETIKT